MTKKPTVNSPQAKALELPQYRHKVIPDKKIAAPRYDFDHNEECIHCGEDFMDCECHL